MTLLERVKELKREYNIGSKDAYYYVKSLEYWDSIRSQLQIDAGVQEISRVADKFYDIAENALEMATINQILEYYEDNLVNDLQSGNPYIDQDLRQKIRFYRENNNMWALDYPVLLKNYFSQYEGVILNGIKSTFATAIDDNIPIFIKQGERYSVQDLFDGKIKLTDPDTPLGKNDLEGLELIRMNSSILIENLTRKTFSGAVDMSEGFTQEEAYFLFKPHDLYWRMERERVLERREYQQVFAKMIIRNRPFATTQSINEHIDGITQDYEARHQKRKERFKLIMSLKKNLKLPQFDIDKERKLIEDFEQHHKYTIRAIRNNKRYLEQVLELPLNDEE